MYMHIDGPMPGEKGGYKLARVGVAISDTVDGNYKYLKSFRPLGHESRDIGQFIDDDGTPYLIFEDRPFGFRIATLSADYLNVEKEVCLIPLHLEGGAIVHYDGLYYAIGSALTGWDPNPNKYATAKSLAGPWSEFRDIAPPETKTYGSQSTMMIKVTGTKATTVIYMGDIWKPKTQWDSRYLWMPLEIGGGNLRLPRAQALDPRRHHRRVGDSAIVRDTGRYNEGRWVYSLPPRYLGIWPLYLVSVPSSRKATGRLKYLISGEGFVYTAHFALLGNFPASSSAFLSATRTLMSIRWQSAWAGRDHDRRQPGLWDRLRYPRRRSGCRCSHRAPPPWRFFYLSGIPLRLVLLGCTIMWLINNIYSHSIGGTRAGSGHRHRQRQHDLENDPRGGSPAPTSRWQDNQRIAEIRGGPSALRGATRFTNRHRSLEDRPHRDHPCQSIIADCRQAHRRYAPALPAVGVCRRIGTVRSRYGGRPIRSASCAREDARVRIRRRLVELVEQAPPACPASDNDAAASASLPPRSVVAPG